MKSIIYKILLVTGLLAGMACAAYVFLPWKILAEKRLAAALEVRGLRNIHFTLSEMDQHSAVFRDVRLGDGRLLELKNLAVHYSLPPHEVSAEGDTLHFSRGSLKGTAAKADIHAKNMEGDWHLSDVQAEAGSVVLPAMDGAGKFKYGTDTFLLSGQFKSKDGGTRADFSLDYPSAHPQDARLTLTHASMPWQGGKLTAKNMTVPLGGTESVKLSLQVERVSIQAVLQALTGQNVSATGTVSGNLPVIIGQDGMVSFGAGALQATGAGVVIMPPEAIPGDNAQVAMVREILKNFHYKGFSIAVRNEKDGGISLLAALEGNNPDMYGGHPVKLNVRLAGDVLGYIRQNVLFLTSPETMLKQDRK